MVMALLVVPTQDNDGRPFPPAQVQQFEMRLRIFGGFQRIRGVYGEWVSSSGQLFRDNSRIYRSEFPVQRLAEWLAVVEWARVFFRQEAMWVEIHGQGTIGEA